MYDYPLFDSIFIALSLSCVLFMIWILWNVWDKNRVDLIVTIIIGLITLQAAWPIVAPRISLEDINQEKGILIADKNLPLMVREANIHVKPPLIPLPFLVNKTYPIANNLISVAYDDSSPNLQIGKADTKNVYISLKRVTGWSFDEIAGKIKYTAEKPFDIKIQDLIDFHKTNNLEGYELYPYDYRDSMLIENHNTFPVEIQNLPFRIEKDTPTWNGLKNWIDDGFCISARYSEQWDYRSSAYALYANGKLISKEEFDASNITLQIPYIHLSPQERKEPDIIYKEIACREALKNISQRTQYIISGKITSKEDLKYLVIVLKYANNNHADTSWAYPNKEYRIDLAKLPNSYAQGDIIQVNICRNAQDCIASKNITIDMEKGISENIDFNI